MKFVFDDSNLVAYIYYRQYMTVIRIGEIILESSETKFIDLPPYVFDVDHVAKIRSELSTSVLEKTKVTLDAGITALSKISIS